MQNNPRSDKTLARTMKLVIATLFIIAVEATTAEMPDHSALRTRKLPKCIKKGRYCTPYPDECCGGTICQINVCCIPEDVNGCDFDTDCCPVGDDDETPLTCIDSLCAAGVPSTEEPRPCGIHGEECVDFGDQENDCCGDVNYLCELVSISEGEGDTRCCFPLGTKGCSYSYHCCGEDVGNQCVESRCVDENGEYPDDSVGTRDCSLKGGACTDVSDCCGGDTKYKCEGEPNDLGETTCCLKSNINGCSLDSHCCGGHCEVLLSLCCIENGQACEHDLSYECCSGYCDSSTNKCAAL